MKKFKSIILSIFFLALSHTLPAMEHDSYIIKRNEDRQQKSGNKDILTQVVQKYLTALGGENKIRMVKSKRIRYRVFMATRGGYIMEQFIQRPGLLRSGRPGADQYFDFDGKKIWRVKGKKREEIKGPLAGSFKKMADLNGPFIDPGQKGITLTYLGKKRYEFSQLHQVEVVFKDKEKRRYFFDDKSGLPVIMKKPSFQMINNKVTPGPTSVYYYFDFKDVQGIKYPHLWVQTDEGQNHLHVFQIDKITLEKEKGER